MRTVIGIDLGTQCLKVVFYDFKNRSVLAVEASELDLHQDNSGVAEQQANWWIDALHTAIAKVDPDIRKTAIAIGVSGQQHGFVPLSGTGEVLAPVKLWCDTSTQAQCEEITDKLGGAEKCIEEIGNPILPGYTASKVLWFRQEKPELYEQMTTILLPHDYLNYYLTGECCAEAGDASGTGFFDIRTRSWSGSALRAIDPDRDLAEAMPTLRNNNECIGQLLPAVAERLDLPTGIPVSIGGGDNMMAAIGTGNVLPGRVTISLGTSGTVYAYADEPVIDRHGNFAAFCSSTGGWLPLLCTMNCTVATETMRNMLDTDIPALEMLVNQAERGSAGVITVPYFNGERTPNLTNAEAWIVGLDSQNTQPENLLRSAMEGATYALRSGVDALRISGIQTDEIVLTGGGINSPTWRQLVADICDAPVTVLEQEEGAAFGAALQALAIVEDASLPDLVSQHLTKDESRCCKQQPAAVEFYRGGYENYQKVAEAMTPLYK
jgi:xylulokinase